MVNVEIFAECSHTIVRGVGRERVLSGKCRCNMWGSSIIAEAILHDSIAIKMDITMECGDMKGQVNVKSVKKRGSS